MNYRRGLQRVYAVITVVWIAAWLFALPSYRLRFWVAPVDDSYATRVKESKGVPGILAPLPEGYVLEHTIEWEKQNKAKKQQDCFADNAPPATEPIRYSVIPNEPVFAESRTGKTLWLAAVLFGPPVTGYLGAFLIVPWVYRGFRPSPPIDHTARTGRPTEL